MPPLLLHDHGPGPGDGDCDIDYDCGCQCGSQGGSDGAGGWIERSSRCL